MSLKLDEIDRKILEKLQKNARIAFRKIAEEVGVSEATIFVRVKKLIEQNVIKGFTTIISPDSIGRGLTAFILIKADPRKYSAALEILRKMDDVCEIYDVTGNYYAILKVRTESRESLAEILDSIGLIEGITSTETALVLRSIKEEAMIKI